MLSPAASGEYRRRALRGQQVAAVAAAGAKATVTGGAVSVRLSAGRAYQVTFQ